MTRLYFILCLLGLVCVACQPKANTPAANETTGFSINHQDDSTVITIYSPWQKGHVLQQLAIGNEPLAERVVCTSATHIGFIHELGMQDKVIGVSRPDRIYNLTNEERQRIVDIGDDFQPNMEALLLCKWKAMRYRSRYKPSASPCSIATSGWKLPHSPAPNGFESSVPSSVACQKQIAYMRASETHTRS